LANEADVPAYRRIGIRIINWVAGRGSNKTSDTQSGFRAYSRKAIEAILPTEAGMGVSTEILLRAEEMGLRIKEVPVKIIYDVERPSKMNPIIHGLDVIFSTIKHLSIRHPLIFYGVPGVLCLLTALVSGLMLIHLFNLTRYFSLPLAVVAVGFGLFGAILCSTAIMLWILVSLIKETK
jgi:hypothetical protein